MATFLWSALTNGQTITTFNPSVDVFHFDDAGISAADVRIDGSDLPPELSFTYAGKTVTIEIDPYSTTTSNVTFADGSLLLIGDNAAGIAGDDGANTLTGGSGDDQLIGLGGADSLSGGGGNDRFTMGPGPAGVWGNDTIRGGAGVDWINFNNNDAVSGLVVTYTGFDSVVGALATITGGDGSPGSTVTLSGVERVTGTEYSDIFTGTTAIPVNGLNTDVTLVFDGAGGNDTINGATGDGRNTFISYGSAGTGVTVNLGTGTASNDGLGGFDTFTNIDGVLGSNYADSITGGSGSVGQSGTFFEFFEGFGGNDTINGGSGGDRVQYDNSPSAVLVNLDNGTASDGWGGFDTLISINQARGSAFNDTFLGGQFDDQFEGQDGNDVIDGGDGFDAVRYNRASGGVYVNLATGEGRALDTVAGAGVGVDSFTNIEEVRGGDFADSLVGGGAGLVEIGAGAYSGAEAFEGRAGNDTIDGGDTVVGSGSIDLAIYFTAPSAVIVNLGAATVLGVASNTANDGYGVNGNPAGIDTLVNINGILGSSFNDTLIGGNNDEFFEGRRGADSIVGGGGIDTLENYDAPAAAIINLEAGVYNDGWGTVDIVSGIENVIGTDFDDNITGDANANWLGGEFGADTLTGGLGNDTLDGGEDTDWASYVAASGAVTVNLTAGTATGAAGNDTLLNIEYVFGSNFNDSLTGNEDQNFLRGNLGNDTLDGGGQSLALERGNFQGDFADYLGAGGPVTVSLALQGVAQNTGAAGLDTLNNIESLRGSNSASGDTLTGDAGNNFLRGGLGNDTLNGGAGTMDFADYRNATASITASLATNTSSGADGADSLSNIEGLSGSDFNDMLTGNAGDNWFRGRNGNDTIDGGGGFDMVTYRPSGGVFVDLGAGTATGSEGFDTLTGIEGAEGSMFNDTLTGANGVDNALFGFDGDDLLRQTTGADTLDGGAGFDRVDFSQTGVAYSGVVGVTVNLATGVSDLNSSAAGANTTLVSIENVTGTAGNDSLTGGDTTHAPDSLGNAITESFRPLGGNDTITGGTGNGFNTRVDYSTSIIAVTVNLGTGTANDGMGGVDTLVRVEQAFGGSDSDALLGGSQERSGNGGFFEFFRGNAGDDFINGAGTDTVLGAAGSDRVNYGNSTAAVIVNLGTTSLVVGTAVVAAGTARDGFGFTDTLLNIDQVEGSSFDDTLVGGASNHRLIGGAGDDSLVGGAFGVEASYQNATASVTANLATGTASDGQGCSDVLVNISDLRGGDFDDVLTGDSGENRIIGDAGADTIDGGAGIDFANYSTALLASGGINAFIQNGAGLVGDGFGSIDTLTNIEGLIGSHANDTLTGGLGDQWFVGRGGSDVITGGAGLDWTSYLGDPAGVTVNLGTGTANDGWGGVWAMGGTDTLSGIENVLGSSFNDLITGNGLANVLRGGDGDDTLAGGLGNDTLDGGEDTQDWASYVAASSAVTVNLTAGTATGAAGNDTLLNIEYVLGSNFADTLTGDEDQNFLRGNLGNDTLNGGGQSLALARGNFQGDYADYQAATGAVVVSLLAGTATGADGNDTLVDIESVRGSNFGDTLTGDAGNNFLRGGLGNDTLNGGAGTMDFADYRNATASITASLATNTSSGADGADSLSNIEGLSGSDFADTLTGNAGDNWFRGRNGNDTINGGGGFDMVTYRPSGGVFVNLGAGTATGSEGSDTLTSIEGAEGSMFNDTLTGANGVDNALFGFDGDDLLRQTTGVDTLDGGAGFDRVDFSQTGVAYSGVVGVTVNLATGVSDLDNSAAGANATLISIEAVNGSFGNDSLTGGDASHAVPDSFGNTFTEAFRPFSGNDTITGGDPLAGFQARVEYVNNTNGQPVTVDLGAGTASDGLGGTDTLVNVNGVHGGAGADMLTGGGAGRGNSGTFFENLRGNAGNDTIDGGDSFHGGGMGSDRADYGNSSGAVIANLGTAAIVVGTETIQGGTAKDGQGGVDTLIDINQVYGGNVADTLVGGAGNDQFSGGAGNDHIVGGAGRDDVRYDNDLDAVIVNLSSGNLVVGETTVAGGTARDGSGSTDTLIGIEGVDGSDFSDYIRGSDAVATVEVFEGLAGNDTIDGGTGIDFASWARYSFVAGGINVSIAGGVGSVGDGYGGTDTLINIEGLEGTSSDDTLTGGAGIQWFRGRGGSDIIDGGTGLDWVSYRPDPVGVTVNLQTGTATDGWDGPGGVLALGGTDTLISIENAEGSDFDDTLTGSSAGNELRGLDGDDALTGGGGNDTLDGGLGNDNLVGGIGNDTYVRNAAGDVVTELADQGTDTVQSAVDDTLGANVENLTLTGAAAIDGTGNTLANILTGNTADNALNGGAGNDTLNGGAGNDTLDGGAGVDSMTGGGGDDLYFVDDASDVVVEAPGGGIDTLVTTVSLTLVDNVENIRYEGPAGGGIFGNSLDNVIGSQNAGNTLGGGDGIDTVSYAEETASLTIDLQAGEATGTATDTLFDFENAVGGSNDDILIGTGGENSLDGSDGEDTMTGGAGDDIYFVNDAQDVVVETTNDVPAGAVVAAGSIGGIIDTVIAAINFSLANVAFVENLTLAAGAAVVATGNTLNNVLTGNSGNNVLNGSTGNDTMAGGAGNDTYVRNAAGDVVTELENEGTDTVQSAVTYTLGANVENLTLTGGAASNGTGNTNANAITGNISNNVLNGGAGVDTMTGGLGNDTYVLDAVGDVVTELAGQGNDLVQSAVTYALGANLERLTLTGAGNINATGNGLANVLTGNNGANRLNGGAGNDTLNGGAGDDTYIRDAVGDVVTELANQGIDTVQSAVTYTLEANVENLTLTGAAAINGIGNTLNNVITGNSGNNVLNGITGNDTLDGGLGIDTLAGGAGDDTYIRNAVGDVVTELANQGIDTVQSAVTYTLGANVENLTLTGAAAINGTGNTLNNVITGNSGNNVLNGIIGNDTMAGGAGNDTYVRNVVGDVVTEEVDEGIDTVHSAVTYTLGANVENLTLTGAAAINGTGNTLANVLTGNTANNMLSGSSGNDTLNGGLGNDTLTGGAGDDTYVRNVVGDVVTELANQGIDTVQSAVTYTLGANVENLTLTGAAAINGIGNILNNVITGNSGNNVLNGITGNDTLDGGLGIDTLAGGAGDDTYIRDAVGDVVTELANQGIDTVQSAVTYTLGANVENLTLTGAAAINGTGNTLNNVITGNSGNNVLNGIIGNDTMAGGAGNDTYVRNVVGDVVTEEVDEGIDTVHSAVTYTLGANVENLTLTGAAAINGTGNTLANVLTGNTANNMLSGSSGNDTLNGGLGNDTLTGGAGDDTYVRNVVGDVVTELANQGIDTVQSAVTYTLGANVENLALTGAAAINGTGNTLANVLTGNTANNTLNGSNGNDTLDGGLGNDTLAGGVGNDTYIRNAAGDVVMEEVDEGIDTVQSAVTYTLGANVENLTLTGAGAINGNGNTLNNVINGNSGTNVLNGSAGNDTLNGSTGADTLNGGDGNDTLVWDALDTSVNGGTGTDTLRVDGATALDLTAVLNNKILNVETINLAGTNTLTLALDDVLAISSTDILKVDGGVGDTVHRGAGWTQGADQGGYHAYTQGLATLLVDADIASVI